MDARFGEGAYATLLKTLEKNRMDDKNLVARPEIDENEAVAWLARTFEAHNPWVPKNYVLAYAQVLTGIPTCALPLPPRATSRRATIHRAFATCWATSLAPPCLGL